MYLYLSFPPSFLPPPQAEGTMYPTETPELKPHPSRVCETPGILSIQQDQGWAGRGRTGRRWRPPFICQECSHSLGVTPKNETLEIQSIYLEKSCMLVILDILPDEAEILF